MKGILQHIDPSIRIDLTEMEIGTGMELVIMPVALTDQNGAGGDKPRLSVFHR
jgi:hypothetical protein